MTHAALPRHLYVHVRKDFLTKNPDEGGVTIPGVLHGLYTPLNEVAYGHLLLDDGSHWCGIPIHAISLRPASAVRPVAEPTAPVFDHAYVQPWGNMGETPVIVDMPYLSGMAGHLLIDNRCFVHTGMILDWKDGGFVRSAEQHKPLHLVALESLGTLALMPNNYVCFTDESTKGRSIDELSTVYRRNNTRWFPEQ